MKSTTLVASAVLIACLASAAGAQRGPSNGFIGVYSDPAGTICCFNAAPGGQTTLYLIAVTNGATGSGITGAEFRVEVSAPAGYFFGYTAPAGTTTLGDPMDTTPGVADAKGLNVAYPSCRPVSNQMPGDHVDLGTVVVVNFGGGPTDLLVKRKYPGSSPIFLCPLFTLCDAPAYTPVCATLQEGDPALLGQEPVLFTAMMNKNCSGVTCGFVPVAPATWSSIKEMYR